jgi:predicted Ser/Thr protein kinase
MRAVPSFAVALAFAALACGCGSATPTTARPNDAPQTINAPPYLTATRVLLGGLCCLLGPALMGGLALGIYIGNRRANRATERRSDRRPPRPTPVPSLREQVSHCPECDAALPADAPEGLCPQCLLKGVVSSVHNPIQATPGEATGPYVGPATAPSVEELAPHFPQLEVLELIGEGGMGAVYKARQPSLDRLVAVKVLPRQAGQDAAFTERFNREARALARLGHPNVVAVYDVGKAGEFYYFVMEYVDGANLRQVLRDGHLTPEQALRIVPQICDALQYAHEDGVVHRDIKPENILLDKKGRVKIADFGLAKLLGRGTGHFTLTGSQQVLGTLYYMAPEQVERPADVDHRADIYSLGVVFYEMLTGQLPVGRFPMPSEKAGTEPYLDEVVLRAMEREPAKRYQHASDVKTDVEQRRGQALAGGLPLAPDHSKDESVREQVEWPALGLMLAAAVNWLGQLILGALAINDALPWYGLVPQIQVAYVFIDPRTYLHVSLFVAILTIAATGIIFLGGLKLWRLESRRLALIAAVLVLIVPPAYPIGWPVGMWALVVLTAPEVKAAFSDSTRRR